MNLACYQKMYAILCVAASNAIDLLKNSGNAICVSALLQKALTEAEEVYLCEDEVDDQSFFP